MNKAKTNNSHLYDKVALRLAFLPDTDQVTVLDCYHGTGVIWRNVQRNTEKKITVHGIDISDDDVQMPVLLGDNMKIFDSLDIRQYDVIDLDAWGIPAKQFTAIWPQVKKGAVVFYTFCQNMLGQLGMALLTSLGYAEQMIQKCPTLFAKNAHKKFISFLSCNGCCNVVYLRRGRKYYGMVRKD